MSDQLFVAPYRIRGFFEDTVFAWSLVKMGDVVDLHYGKALKVDEREEGFIPVYGTNGITGWHNEALVDGPTVILGRKGMGHLGVEWCSGQCWVIDTAYYSTIDETRLNFGFFFYFVHYVGLNHLKDGTSNPGLNRDVFASQYIPLPPLEEQRAIAHILGSIDDKIEANRRQNETLEATAHTIFKSWFVDFDPAHTKAKGEQPVGMDATTAALFPESFEDSELGMIPAGWRVGTLEDIANYQNGLAMQKYLPTGNDFLPVVKIRELRQGFTDENSGKADPDIREDCILYDGDVVFSWSGSLLLDIWTGGIAGLNQHLFKVTSDQFPRWFYYFWTSHHLDEFIRIAETKATTMGHIKRIHLKEALVTIPSAEVLEYSHGILEPYLEEIITLRLQSRTLNKTRDTLLPKLLSGEIRVKGE